MSDDLTYWKRCKTCNKEIQFNQIYQKCTVSSCKKNVYCSVDCWELHVPVMNHKSASAEENRAPQKDDYLKMMSNQESPKRRIIPSKNNSTSNLTSEKYPKDILIVASKLKNYVKAKGDLNTSSNVMDRLSDLVRVLCDDAIEHAKAEGRKTLMDRDFK